MSGLSTVEVARQAGVGRATLERWLANGELRGPKTVRFGKREFRDWTAADLDRVRKHRHKNYRKHKSRKPTK